jgi:hypothetical protein
MPYIHSYVLFSSKFGDFIPFFKLLVFVWSFYPFFYVFWYSKLGVTSLYLVQFGYKFAEKIHWSSGYGEL